MSSQGVSVIRSAPGVPFAPHGRAPSVGSRQDGVTRLLDTSSVSASNYSNSVLSKGWLTGAVSIVQGAVYSVTRVHRKSQVLAVLLQIFEILQIVTFILSPDSDWTSLGGLNLVLSWSNLGVARLSVVLYYVALAVITVQLPFAVANVFYVGSAFLRADFSSVWPLRTLRYFLGGLMDVLYIPVLSILTAPLACGLDPVSGAMLWTPNPSVAEVCWQWPFVLPQVISILDLVVFIPMSLVVILVSFDSNPLSQNWAARSTGRPGMINLFLRTALVIISRFSSTNMARAVVVFIIGVLLAVTQLYYVPYFNKSFNHFNAVMYSIPISMSVVYIVMAASGSPTLAHTIAVFTLPVVLAPFAYGISALRFKWLERKATSMALSEARNDVVTPLNTSNPSLSVSTPYEAWLDNIRPKSGHTFPSTHFVEVYARFALSGGNDLPVPERLRRATAIYEAGLRQYATDATVRMAYATFQLFYRNDPGLANHYLLESKKNQPVFDIQFQIYARENDAMRERRAKNLGEDALDVISYVELQKNMKHALRYHREAIAKMRSFWGYLLQSNADVAALPSYMQAITAAEKKASDSYKHLVKKFSRSPTVLRHYADFCMSVTLDYDQAHHYYQFADSLAEEKGENANTLQLSSLNGSSRARHRMYRQRVLNRGSSTNRRFGWVMLGMLSVMAISMIVQFALGSMGFSDERDALENTRLAGIRRRQTQELLIFSRAMETAARTNDTDLYERATRMLTHSANLLRESNRGLFVRTIGDSNEVDDSWQKPCVTVVYITGTDPEVQAQVDSTMVDAINVLVDASLRLATVPMAECYNLRETADFRFLAINANADILAELDTALQLFLDHWYLTNTMMIIIQCCIFGAMFIALIAVSLLVYRPAFKALEKERHGIVALFKNIPHSAVAQIFNNLQNEKEGEDDVDVFRITDAKAMESKQSSTMRRSRLQYWIAVWFLLTMGLVFFLLPVLTAQTSTHYGPEVRFGGGLNYFAARMRYYANEIIVDDHETYSHEIVEKELIDAIVSMQDEFRYVLYGNASLNLPGFANRFAPVQNLMDTDTCVTGNTTQCAEFPLTDGVQGLEALKAEFVLLARRALTLAGVPDAAVVNATLFEKISYIHDHNMLPGLDYLVELLQGEANSTLTTVVYFHATFFGLTLLLMLMLQLFLFRPMVRLLMDESSKTAAMLLMIPPRIIDTTPLLKSFFEAADITELLSQQIDIVNGVLDVEAALHAREAATGTHGPSSGAGTGQGTSTLGALSLAAAGTSGVGQKEMRKEVSSTSVNGAMPLTGGSGGGGGHGNQLSVGNLPQMRRSGLSAVTLARGLLAGSADGMFTVDTRTGLVLQTNEPARSLFELDYENKAVGKSISTYIRFAELLVAAGNGVAVRTQTTDSQEMIDVRVQEFTSSGESVLLFTVVRADTNFAESSFPPGTVPWAMDELLREARPAAVTSGPDLLVVTCNTQFLQAVNEEERAVRGYSAARWIVAEGQQLSEGSSSHRSRESAFSGSSSAREAPVILQRPSNETIAGQSGSHTQGHVPLPSPGPSPQHSGAGVTGMRDAASRDTEGERGGGGGGAMAAYMGPRRDRELPADAVNLMKSVRPVIVAKDSSRKQAVTVHVVLNGTAMRMEASRMRLSTSGICMLTFSPAH